MKLRRAAASLAVISCVSLAAPGSPARAQVLVGDPLVSGASGWVDAFPGRGGTWRLSLHAPTLMDTNNANPPVTGGGTNTGLYEPDVLVQNNFTAPAQYDVAATMRTNDDDLIGLVWNYQDPSNYFRVGLRQQPASGNFGGTQGLSVQKIVGGTVTQLFPAANVAGPDAITQAMIDNRTPFDVRVAVNGANYEVFFNGTSYTSGSDADLAAGRKVGVQSWAQLNDSAATPLWGSEFDAISVMQGASTLYSQNFGNRSVRFRQLVMTNAASVPTPVASRGNFGLDLNRRWVYQQSNGFENATVNNTDFIGPAVVVDEPGSAAMGDYEMRVRLGATDNDGMGVLVRVQDDNNFYRVTLTNEATGAGITRAPRGLSVQKVRNGVWSELYRDVTPQFVYTPGTVGTTPETGLPMFDLSVTAVGNTLDIQVTDGLGNLIDYPLITDGTDPLLAGTVGLHTWGTDNVYYTSFGGQPGPLVVAIPEPATAALAVAAAVGCLALRNRRRPLIQ